MPGNSRTSANSESAPPESTADPTGKASSTPPGTDDYQGSPRPGESSAPAGPSGSPYSHGIIAGLFAYTAWGFFPVYFRALDALRPAEILGWRIVLAVPLLVVALWWRDGFATTVARLWAIRDRGLVLAATLLIALNWLTFIVAVDRQEVLQASLGYFLVPVINTALGMLFFAERPNRLQRVAVAVAAGGMAVTFLATGTVPILALILAGSFGLYGAVRKRVSVDSLTGLFLETALLAPAALAWIVMFGTDLATVSGATQAWLALAGAMTIVPLGAMVFAARHIELGTLGMLQYITPTLQFGVAVGLYGEPLDLARGLALLTTLAAVVVWTTGLWRRGRASHR